MRNIEKIFKKILLEMSGTRRLLFHYTNTEGLRGILSSGEIKLGYYPINVDTEEEIFQNLNRAIRGRAVPYELATQRPSLSKTTNVQDLSTAVGHVKIIIKPYVLADKIRGIKVKPIAEFPLNTLKWVKMAFKEKGFLYPLREARKLIEKASGMVQNYDQLGIREKEKVGQDFSNWVYKQWGKNIFDNPALNDMVGKINEFYRFHKKREGEERIVSRREEGIPLNKDYTKIELLSGFSENFEQGFIRKTQFEESSFVILEIAKWLEFLKKWKDLFVENKELEKFQNTLMQMKKEYGESGKTKKKSKTKFEKNTERLKEI